jgi:alpha-tubulin suppressor-like RCC1 family protein
MEDTVSVPTQIPLLVDHKCSNIIAGASFTMIITESGSVFGCGDNYYGQLATGSKEHNVPIPQRSEILSDKKIKCIANGTDHTIALFGK